MLLVIEIQSLTKIETAHPSLSLTNSQQSGNMLKRVQVGDEDH